MPDSSELSIMPCRDSDSGKWFCEVVVNDTGKTLFCSDFRQTRAGAIARAQVQIVARKAFIAQGAGR